MRKVITTAAGTRMRPALECALPTFERFAAAHGYSVVVHRFSSADEHDPAGRQRVRWRKIDLLREAVDRFDLVLWLDADTIVRRFDQDIADDLPSGSFQGLVRERFPTRVNPNTGVWLLRGATAASRFLEVVAGIGQLDHSWADQAAVCQALGWDVGDHHGHGARPTGDSPYRNATAWLPDEWNAVRERPGARIRHFAGMPMQERLEAMQADVRRFHGRPATTE